MDRDGSRMITAYQVDERMLWELLRGHLRGARSSREIFFRGLDFLNRLFRPRMGMAAEAGGLDGGLRIVALCRGPGAAPQEPSPRERENLQHRWSAAMARAISAGRAVRHGRTGRFDYLIPLITAEGPKGIMVLSGVADRKGFCPVDNTLGAVSEELAERLALLEPDAGRTASNGRGSKGHGDRVSADGRGGSDIGALEAILAEVTREAQNRKRELREVKKQLASMKTFNESVLQSLSSGLISVDQMGHITYMNRGAEKILQYSFDEVMGKPLSAAMASKDKRDLLDIRERGQETSTGRQILVTRKDGVEIPIGFTISPHRDAQGKEIGRILHFRDLTEINEMQEELLRMDRLVSLGEVSMGIAHEIRNPLAGIRITAQALEEEVSSNEMLREYVARIISEIDRLNDLLKSFFSFAKPQRPRMTSCHLPDLIRDVLFLVRKDLEKRQIEATQEHPNELPMVDLDVNQIKQVLLNMMLNAIQAISRDGRIHVSTSLVSKGGRREVLIRISDTGRGMPSEHLSKIFDPFFTTKAKGLGLGLSNTYRIIKRHGGRIRVQSEVGKGTTFGIFLPLERKQPGKAPREGV